MTTLKGLSGTILKQIHSGKSGRRLTDEADVSQTPNVNTGDTYNYEMQTLTSFYVRATKMYRRSVYLIFPPSLRFQGQRLELIGGQEDTERRPQTFNE